MQFSKTGLLAISLAALAASGCTSSRFSSVDTQPAPLEAAPSGTVTGNQLPPPAAAGPPAGAPDVTTGSVAGVWNASVSGQSCRIATPQTKFGSGFRAGPLRCPAPIDGVKSWNVAGKQLTLYGEDGSTLARLYASGAEKFDGQTSSGLPISLTR